MIVEELYDFRFNELSLKKLRKNKDIRMIEKPLLKFIIPIGIFYFLHTIFFIKMRLGESKIFSYLFFVITGLGLIYIGLFIKYAKNKDLGYKYVMQGEKKLLLVEYRALELVNFLKKNGYISGILSKDDLSYDMLIKLCESTALNSNYSWGATPAIIGVLGIVFSLVLSGCLKTVSSPEIVLGVLFMIALILVFGFIRRIYYEHIDSRRYKLIQLSIELQNLKIESHKMQKKQ